MENIMEQHNYDYLFPKSPNKQINSDANSADAPFAPVI